MPSPDADLARLQLWLQHRIVGDAAPPHDSSAAPSDFIRGSAAFPAQQRLSVYAHSYALRLIECLREEFPALRLLVGDQVFDLFAGAYIANRPPKSRSLYTLGAGFADFLEATKPEGAAPGSLEAIPADLARLERAISESQRAVGIEAIPAAGLPSDWPFLLSSSLRLLLPDAVRLLHLDFDFAETLAAARRGERPLPPPARETWVAVARSRYRVRAHLLSRERFAWLHAIGHHGARMRDAVAAAARRNDCDAGELLVNLLIWLPDALAAGLVALSA